jgi:hypothetical protein
MTKRLRPALALTLPALACLAAGATAATVKLTPVKGATYAGIIQGRAISLKVDRHGTTAKISLASAPAFCSSGAAPEAHSAKQAKISKKGALSDTITYFTGGISPQTLATVVLKGHFFTFGKTTPVFDGTAKVTYVFAGTSDCSGQASFQAVKK